MSQIQVPVLIVGAGGAGLSAANFLTDLGVEHMVVERHLSTSHLPKAHYLNQRTMEIFRHHGLAEEIYAWGAPRENMGKISWYTCIGGDGPVDGLLLHEQDALGGGGDAATYDLKGATPPTNLPQLRLEPLLQQSLHRRGGRVLFRHELASLAQDADGVDALIRNRDTAEEIQVRARYLIAADGGKTINPSLGVEMIGPKDLAAFTITHFTADLSKDLREDRAVMRILLHPEQMAAGHFHPAASLLSLGPKHWDRHSEEWALFWAYHPADSARHTADDVLPRIREYLKIDGPIDVHYVSHWGVEAIVADRFQEGRVFIVGDAAHKHTPASGLGLNSAIQDVHNLCWKLALVLRGGASPELLASYETERRPVVERNARWSLFALSNYSMLVAATGLSMEASLEANVAAVQNLLSDTFEGESRRARMREMFGAARIEYAAHDQEMGFVYPAGALVDDEKPFPPRDPMGSDYTPSSRPGCRLPHAWLHHDGGAVSTHDLIPVGGFLLIAGEDGLDWCAAAAKVAADFGVHVRAVRVGEHEGDAIDTSGAWTQVRETGRGGAVLVRPDGHVGYRSQGAVADAVSTLRGVMEQVLARPTGHWNRKSEDKAVRSIKESV